MKLADWDLVVNIKWQHLPKETKNSSPSLLALQESLSKPHNSIKATLISLSRKDQDSTASVCHKKNSLLTSKETQEFKLTKMIQWSWVSNEPLMIWMVLNSNGKKLWKESTTCKVQQQKILSKFSEAPWQRTRLSKNTHSRPRMSLAPFQITPKL